MAAQLMKASLSEIAVGVADSQTLNATEAISSQSRDFAEGRLAFKERRKAVFIGA
jgi:hypothetical protein